MEKTYLRSCPICSKEVTYTNYQAFWSGRKHNKQCGSCAQRARCVQSGESEKRRISMEGRMKGESNPFYGKRHSSETIDLLKIEGAKFSKLRKETRGNYDIWLDKLGKQEADKKLAEWKQKASEKSSGHNNPMYGKPSPIGSGNGWSGWYKGWFFRSLGELSYMVGVIEKENHRWRSAESQDLRIEYIDWQGVSRNYFADFILDDKILVECKPSKLHTSKTVQLKSKAAVAFCEDKGYEYRLVDPVKLSDFEIATLRDGQLLKFTDRYEEKFKERISKQFKEER